LAENFYTMLTILGKNKLSSSAISGSKVNFKTLKVGDGNGAYYEPSENQTSLMNQVWEGNISSISTDENNSNWIVVETVIPASDGGFFIREAGIFDEDGDLIAVSKVSETYKPVISEGSSKDVSIKIVLEVSNADNVTLKIDPNVVVATKNDIEVLEVEIQSINTNMSDIKKGKANQSDLDITNANLSMKADDTDNSRNTTSKTVTGAINELNTNKSPIANPIFTGSVKTLKNTLDDGNGNVIVANNISIYNSIGFNRNVPNGVIFNNSEYAYQFSHYGSSSATNDILRLEVYNGSGTVITSGALCVNGNGYIGINNLLPSYTLDVSGIVNGTKFLAAESNTTEGGYSFTVDGAQDTGMFSSGDGQLNFYSNGVLVFTISPSGSTQLYGYNIARALSGGYKIQSGTISVSAPSNSTQGIGFGFPVAFSSIPIVIACHNGPSVYRGDYVDVESISTTGATLWYNYSTGGSKTVSWIAIGN
jgi:hypothetical protein